MELNFNGRKVGEGYPPYIIAEIGANHNGDMQLAKDLIAAAKEAGADAAKFQSWSNKTLISKAEYARNTHYDDTKKHFGTLFEMVDKYQFTPEQHYEVAEYCQKQNIDFMSTPFAHDEVDLLVELNVPAIKIASMDVNHLLLLKKAARSNKPIILSTGMANLAEIAQAIDILKDNGAGEISLLHCISIYPPEYKDIHLNNIIGLRDSFGLTVGFSDHSFSTAIPLAAVALGASIIEKHFTLDKSLEGWDHDISADFDELKIICDESKNIFNALGNKARSVNQAEIDKRKRFRRCAVINKDLKAGYTIKLEDLEFKRPGTGINPNEYSYLIGRTLKHDLENDSELSWTDFI